MSRWEISESLKKNVGDYLDEHATNNNIWPAAWNLFYELREQGLFCISKDSGEDPYLINRAFVSLLVRCYEGPRADRESELFEQLKQKKHQELEGKLREKTDFVEREKLRALLLQLVDFSSEALSLLVTKNTETGFLGLEVFFHEDSSQEDHQKAS